MPTQQLDPTVVNLAKAIRQTETGGDFNASGASGEHGGYQFTEPTWQRYASRYGINTPLKQATPEQQNAVAYNKIKEWKDKGFDVTQIASMWNAGDAEPNAYSGKFSDGSPSIGQNKFKVKYDVPKYAESVAKAYTTLKGGGQVSQDPNNPSSLVGTQKAQPSFMEQVGGVAKNVGNFLVQNEKNFGQNVGQAAYSAFGGLGQIKDITNQYLQNGDTLLQLANKTQDPKRKQQLIKQAQGMYTDAGNVGEDILGHIRSNEQQLGDAGGVMLDLFLAGGGLGKAATGAVKGEGLLTKIAKGAAETGKYGAAYGLASGLQENKDVGGVAKSGLIGGATGAALGGVGGIISKAAEYLPQRITRTFLPGINEETAKYAVDKGLGSPKKMLAESDSAIEQLGNELGQHLNNPKYENVKVAIGNLLPEVAQKFPNAGLDVDTLAQKLMQVAPTQKTLIEKLMSNGSLTLDELHTLNSTIGKNTFKSVFDDPATKAGKDIASAFYHAASDFIKTKAPETEGVFAQLSKEYPLNKALFKATRSARKARPFTLRDIVAIMSGFGVGGPVGAGVAWGLEKAAVNPSVNLQAMGLVNKLNNPVTKAGGLIGGILASREAAKAGSR